MSNCKKNELIYLLQVDMGLIAMVTGHVPQHLPSSPPPLPSHSYHSSKGDDTGFFCPLQLLSVSQLHWMLNIHHPTHISMGDVTPCNQQSLRLSVCLIFLPISHFLSATVSLSFSPSLGKNKLGVDTGRKLGRDEPQPSTGCLFPPLST